MSRRGPSPYLRNEMRRVGSQNPEERGTGMHANAATQALDRRRAGARRRTADEPSASGRAAAHISGIWMLTCELSCKRVASQRGSSSLCSFSSCRQGDGVSKRQRATADAPPGQRWGGDGQDQAGQGGSCWAGRQARGWRAEGMFRRPDGSMGRLSAVAGAHRAVRMRR